MHYAANISFTLSSVQTVTHFDVFGHSDSGAVTFDRVHKRIAFTDAGVKSMVQSRLESLLSFARHNDAHKRFC